MVIFKYTYSIQNDIISGEVDLSVLNSLLIDSDLLKNKFSNIIKSGDILEINFDSELNESEKNALDILVANQIVPEVDNNSPPQQTLIFNKEYVTKYYTKVASYSYYGTDNQATIKEITIYCELKETVSKIGIRVVDITNLNILAEENNLDIDQKGLYYLKNISFVPSKQSMLEFHIKQTSLFEKVLCNGFINII